MDPLSSSPSHFFFSCWLLLLPILCPSRSKEQGIPFLTHAPQGKFPSHLDFWARQRLQALGARMRPVVGSWFFLCLSCTTFLCRRRVSLEAPVSWFSLSQ